MIKIIISLFLLGVSFGWGPCVASCGPLIITYIAGAKKNIPQAILTYTLFSSTRISIYLVLGVLVFFLGSFARERLSGDLFKYIGILGGVFIILLGLLMVGAGRLEFKICRFLEKHILEEDKKSIILFGLIVGFSPCAPLLGLFSYVAVVSDSWAQSLLYSLCFGLGTFFSPLILGVVLAGFIPKFLKGAGLVYSNIFRLICGLIIIFLGIDLILRNF
ncbi:MAG: sulfite exporter TauE/SafE family protein [Candidatus Omnitrophica bacterium]|nr:sulfite exporter TauE/SafE family protein [Candidatus Omnitrophota bacterium]